LICAIEGLVEFAASLMMKKRYLEAVYGMLLAWRRWTENVTGSGIGRGRHFPLAFGNLDAR
jgi:hypothetical protein